LKGVWYEEMDVCRFAGGMRGGGVFAGAADGGGGDVAGDMIFNHGKRGRGPFFFALFPRLPWFYLVAADT
jgi:hypothetical protein